jgi:hypothetical protein
MLVAANYHLLRDVCVAGDVKEAASVVEQLLLQAEQAAAKSAALRALDLPPLELAAADEAAVHGAAVTAGLAFGAAADELGMDVPVLLAYNMVAASARGAFFALGVERAASVCSISHHIGRPRQPHQTHRKQASTPSTCATAPCARRASPATSTRRRRWSSSCWCRRGCRPTEARAEKCV